MDPKVRFQTFFQKSSENLTEPFSLKERFRDFSVDPPLRTLSFGPPLRTPSDPFGPKSPFSNVIFQESSENLTEPFSLKESFRDFSVDPPLRTQKSIFKRYLSRIL